MQIEQQRGQLAPSGERLSVTVGLNQVTLTAPSPAHPKLQGPSTKDTCSCGSGSPSRLSLWAGFPTLYSMLHTKIFLLAYPPTSRGPVGLPDEFWRLIFASPQISWSTSHRQALRFPVAGMLQTSCGPAPWPSRGSRCNSQ